jgi:hypothetical protein
MVILGQPLKTVPFGGRNKDLALLDAWLNDETAPPRYLLTAPAGRGKSALLVRWLQHLQEQGRVGRDMPAPWQLVFVPVSIRFETHRPDIFYEAIAARLAEILEEELQPTQTDKGVYYADHCRTLASTAVSEGRRILIILDSGRAIRRPVVPAQPGDPSAARTIGPLAGR